MKGKGSLYALLTMWMVFPNQAASLQACLVCADTARTSCVICFVFTVTMDDNCPQGEVRGKYAKKLVHCSWAATRLLRDAHEQVSRLSGVRLPS